MTDPQDRAGVPDPLARFRRKIGENARAWLAFVQGHRPESADLTREFANLARSANQALSESAAWTDGLALVVGLWPFIELRGHWLAWQPVLCQALAVCRRLNNPADELQICDQLGEVARSVGENRAALTWQAEALALARRLGDPAAIGRVLIHLSQQHLPQGDFQAAKTCCEEAVALLEPLGADAEVAIAHNNWGIACSEEGLTEPALAHFVLAATLFATQGNRRGLAKALHNQGEARLRQGRWAEAGPLYERAIAIALAAGDEVGAVRTRTALAILLHKQGQHEAALELHRGIELFYRRLGDRPMLARVVNNQGTFLLALGRWDEAALAYEQAVHIHLDINNIGEAGTSLLNWVEALLPRGEVAQALLRLQDAKALLDTQPSPAAKERQRHAALLEQALNQRATA